MTENLPRITVVTGGADGIGWAVARRFAAGGHSVALADIDAPRAPLHGPPNSARRIWGWDATWPIRTRSRQPARGSPKASARRTCW